MAVFVKLLPTAALLVAAAGSLGAQAAGAAPAAAAPPACDAAQPSSGNAVRANISLQLALKDQKTNPASASKNLAATVKLLEGNDKDEVARAYVLGSALSMWMNMPNVGLAPKRSAVGFSSNPEATIDLPGAVDSLFKIVEASKPGCSYYTSYWRGGQQVFLDLVNGAIAALNADKLDSAQYYASQAHRLYSGSPYPAMVLGNIANKRNNNEEAIKFWQASATAAAGDTSYRDVQRQVLGNIAGVQLGAARDDKAGKDAKVAAAKQAAATYAQLIAIPGTTGNYLYGGRQNLQTALLLAGDTTAVVASYQPLIANPTSYEYQDLLNSAVAAARANKIADAAKLFEGALQVNPHNRDAMYNLGVEYLALQQYDKLGPIVTRLVAVDPGNPENYYLAARAYSELAKAAKKGTPAVAALNDSAVTWYNRGTKLPVEVSFTEFSPSDKELNIAGTVLDRRDKAAEGDVTTAAPARKAGAAARTAAAKPKSALPPKVVSLKFDALDKSGAVLGSKTVTTKELAPGASAEFRVTIPATNAVAYRYSVTD
ncbi:MAG TPA: FxLYD domain-containing protein [Gemmatimonadaceae bacterium]|jgi:predicted Zn-dependent protease|nr:FxLYD domain-containing protein [Gemmatimonadaceae bacterium]